ncbi:hypothetical protein L6164_011943 [Bauhinia variegata]|uniref:Uncharacterized protein n=1 Tax=Bauhinia variegata TaxID=167791 RepID=A0ACB9P8A5_BAUVA|nr:hypothetical protein L6164_011943 [Bauhinia variegata]
MARKGNQPKNGLGHHGLDHRKGVSGGVLPGKKGQTKGGQVKVFPGDDLPNGSQTSSVSQNISEISSAGVEYNNERKPEKLSRKEKQRMVANHDLEEPTSFQSNPWGGSQDNEVPIREENKMFPRSNQGQQNQKSRLSCLLNGLHTKSVMEKVELIDSMIIRKLRSLTSSMFASVTEWLLRQKPLFVSLTTGILKARDLFRMKIEQAYPIVLKWIMNFGNIILLLSLFWLDCAVRGIDSFVHMGTASFFSVVWCSIFSVISTIGMLKFLIVLVFAASIGLFMGLTLVILVVAILGLAFLWFYGSFWTTSFVIFLGGLAFMLSHERVALLITTMYSVYCAWMYIGWLGLLLALNLSFMSSDVLMYFLKNNTNQNRRSNVSPGQRAGMEGQPGFFNDDPMQASSSENGPRPFADRSGGVPSTSGADSEISSEDEVVRLLNCSDHYSVLGLTRYQNIDVSLLKREYRKKAMLVHPDKNMGNEKAAEAFKKLQNAYEVLIDSLKRKAYDDDLRREELLSLFRQFQSTSHRNGRHGFFASGFAPSDADGEDSFGNSRQIACKKCGNFHVWIYTKKQKSRARWCQDCQDFHQAKDGDGWVEQSSQPFLFGLLQKVDAPCAYVCADSRIYDATEWYICQGMRCPANTHKPSFHVNTSVTSKHSSGKGTTSDQRGRMPTHNMEETMTEEELFEWLQNAGQAGAFDNFGSGTAPESPPTRAGSGNKNPGSGGKRKKKGKNKW